MVAQQPHDVQIMADEQIAHAQLGAQVDQKVQHNGLNRHVQCGRGFIKDQKPGL